MDETKETDMDTIKKLIQTVIDKLTEWFSGDGEMEDDMGEMKAQSFKTENGKKFPKSAFAYTPSDNPSEWKLRLVDMDGKVSVAQLGRAAAAFSSGGFRGNKVQLPTAAVAAVKRKIRAEYHNFGVDDADVPESIKELGMMVWKDTSGQYRWFTMYSNNYRDRDYPPEIISAESHKSFVDKVDKGLTPYPELRHWHVKGSAWGMADWVAYDEENGVAMAMGYVIKGHEDEAEKLANLPYPIATSHGMPVDSIIRDTTDPTIIKEHVTVEISDLPQWAAANELTDFNILKEDSMAIPDMKKAYLKQMGLTDEAIANIEAKNKEVADKAQELQLESKEQTAVVEEVVPVAVPEVKVEPVIPYATKEEVAFVLAGALNEITETLKAINKQLDGVEAEAKQVKEMQVTPTASLAAMVASSWSAIGAKETELRKNASVLKDGPKETAAPKDTGTLTFGHMLKKNILGEE